MRIRFMLIALLQAYLSSSYVASKCCRVPPSQLKKYEHIRQLSHKFLITLGVQKSGTSLLHSLVSNHPDTSNAITHNGRIPHKQGGLKELHFFSQPKIDFGKYLLSFNLTDLYNGKTLIEATPGYLGEVGSACWLKAFLPNAKFMVIVKNPADRALSHYKMRFFGVICRIQNNCKKRLLEGFASTMQKEMNQIKKKNCDFKTQKWSDCFGCFGGQTYISRGLYANQLLEWLEYFSPEQFLIINHNDTYNNLQGVADRVWKFANLEPYQINASAIHGYMGKKYNEDQSVVSGLEKMEQFYAPYNQLLTEVMEKYFHVQDFKFH